MAGVLEDDINAAYEAGITTGINSTTFAPHSQITREQMAAMLVRAYNVKTGKEFKPSVNNTYKDAKKISPTFKDDVLAAMELEFMNGYKNGTFAPKQQANRAQAAKTIYMFLNK